MDYRGIHIDVVHGDVLACPSDLLVLKYAQASYGVDEIAASSLGIDKATLPQQGASLLIQAPGTLAARNLLFLGVEPIGHFGYRSVHEFARRALAEAARVPSGIREIMLTLHGAGFGLDEEAAFESEITGIAEAIEAGSYPDTLRSVIIVERNRGRADRMASLLGSIPDSGRDAGRALRLQAPPSRRADSSGYDSAQQQRAFVAMPFSESFEDVFYYGISPPIRAAGLLCERIDEIPFTGDVVGRMKDMIGSSTIVVADLSNANPNVYLEVGYAWGVGKPCILLCNRATDLKFDVQGQRCLKYGSIKELEKTLSSELGVIIKPR
jgi:hypothetical protein